jgi:hypothetical protein
LVVGLEAVAFAFTVRRPRYNPFSFDVPMCIIGQSCLLILCQKLT